MSGVSCPSCSTKLESGARFCGVCGYRMRERDQSVVKSPVAKPVDVGDVICRAYRVLRKVGEGGMGPVFAAEHIHIHKKVAIKLLHAEIASNEEAVARLFAEARLASSIGHHNIVHIDDVGVLDDGRAFLVMELLDGLPLSELDPLPVARLLDILIQVCHGLAAAHARGIIHRDIKPENIVITRGPNGEDVPKLLDFGIAKSDEAPARSLTRTGTIFGTPYYMAPEMALGERVDARADIYALGVMMYECVAGSLPLRAESFMGILTQHITTPPEPVAQRAAAAGRAVPPRLAEVIMRCLEKKREDRFARVDEVAAALGAIEKQVDSSDEHAGFNTLLDSLTGIFNRCPATKRNPCKRTPCLGHEPWDLVGPGHDPVSRESMSCEPFRTWVRERFGLEVEALDATRPTTSWNEAEVMRVAPRLAHAYRAAKGLARDRSELYVESFALVAAFIAARPGHLLHCDSDSDDVRHQFPAPDGGKVELLLAVFDWLARVQTAAGLEEISFRGGAVRLRYATTFRDLESYRKRASEIVDGMRAGTEGRGGFSKLSRATAWLVVRHGLSVGFSPVRDAQIVIGNVEGRAQIDIHA